MDALKKVCCAKADGGGYLEGAENLLDSAASGRMVGNTRGVYAAAIAGDAFRSAGFTSIKYPKDKSYILKDGRLSEPDLIVIDKKGVKRVIEVKNDGMLELGQESILKEIATMETAIPSFINVQKSLKKAQMSALRRIGIDVLDLNGDVIN